MTDWSSTELTAMQQADELHIASRRTDGTLRPFVTIWVVTVDGAVYIRSARAVNPWFQRATRAGRGRIRVGDLEKDVTFTPAVDDAVAIDAAYHIKYDRYGSRIVGGVVGTDAADRTLRLAPAE